MAFSCGRYLYVFHVLLLVFSRLITGGEAHTPSEDNARLHGQQQITIMDDNHKSNYSSLLRIINLLLIIF